MWTTDNMPDLSGKTAVVTGANSGIGYETALASYKAGAHVVLAGRSAEVTGSALTRMQATGGKGSLQTGLLDLASLESVREFAGGIVQRFSKLDILINNAGVMRTPPSFTKEGFELQFGINFLGHFALTGLLYPLLKATPNSRVVTVSSMAYRNGVIDFSNLRSEHSYEPVREYAQSKLADILLAVELDRRIRTAGDSVLSIAAQPGANQTALSRYMSPEEYADALRRFGSLMEPWQGALPSLYAAVDPVAKSGALYGPHEGGYKGYPAEAALEPHALNQDVARRLWELAEAASGVSFPG